MRCDAAGIRALLSLPQQIWHQLLPNAPLFCFNIGWNKRFRFFLYLFPVLSILSPFLFVVVVVGESFAELRGGVKQLFHAFLFFYWYARLLLAAQERCIRGSKLILKQVEGRGGGKVCD